MFKDLSGSFARHVLTSFLGGFAAWLIQNGATPEDAELIVTGIATMAVFVWSFWNKYKKNNDIKKVVKEKEETKVALKVAETKIQKGLRNEDFNQ